MALTTKNKNRLKPVQSQDLNILDQKYLTNKKKIPTELGELPVQSYRSLETFLSIRGSLSNPVKIFFTKNFVAANPLRVKR